MRTCTSGDARPSAVSSGVLRRLLCLAPLWAACATTAPPCGSDLVTAAPAALSKTSTATLVFDFRRLIGERRELERCLEAELDAQPVRLQPFGNMSAQVCGFPKLIVHAGGQKRVLVTHCNDVEDVGTALPTGAQVHGHALAYRLFEALEFVALRTVRRDIVYQDARSDTKMSARPAFFLEFLDDLLKRTGTVRADDAPRAALDLDVVARLFLFQILIDNRDWRLFDFTSVEGPYFGVQNKVGAHNVFLVRRANGHVVPIAYDLELSGFVGIPRGIYLLSGGHDQTLLDAIAAPELAPKEPWLVRWMLVRLLDFRRRFDAKRAADAERHFRKLRVAVEARIDDETLPAKTRERARAHVDAFYRALRLLRRIDRTKWPVDLYVDGERVCEAVPTGTPFEILEPDPVKPKVRLLFQMRLDEDDAKPMCPRINVGHALRHEERR